MSRKQGSTIFLKSVVFLIGIATLAICIFALPMGIVSDKVGYDLILLSMYLPAISFFIGLYQTWRLLSYIDKNQAFSDLSVKALRSIKLCALVISGLFAACIPYVFYVANKDDAPGVVLVSLVFTFAPLVVAVFVAVLQKLLEEAINIKSENDLTV